MCEIHPLTDAFLSLSVKDYKSLQLGESHSINNPLGQNEIQLKIYHLRELICYLQCIN